MLYDRDYNILTSEEDERIKHAKKYLTERKSEIGISAEVLLKYHELLPNASYYHDSLFPNNYLNIDELKDSNFISSLQLKFKKLIDSDITERDILNFINCERNYLIIASLFHSGFDFGHHEAFLFNEFELTSNYKTDYLLVGKNSGGYHFVFIELENPYNQIVTKSGELGATFRKGIKQVEDWDSWIEGNFSNLRLVFNKYKNTKTTLPEEFTILDKSRINYIVIAGRRIDFNEKTYEIKRRYLKRNNIKILHYDNLIDLLDILKSRKNY